jgi:hypothetical protein
MYKVGQKVWLRTPSGWVAGVVKGMDTSHPLHKEHDPCYFVAFNGGVGGGWDSLDLKPR